MPRRSPCILCFLTVFLILCGLSPFARAAGNGRAPALLKTSMQTPVMYTDPLQVMFAPDPEACKKAYGDRWHERCDKAAGLPEEPGRDIVMEPPLPGSWWWSNSYTLTFSPEKGWPAGQSISITLGEQSLRSGITLTEGGTLSFTTLPNAASVDQARLWVDPDKKGEHGLSFRVRFLYPQPEQADSAFTVSVDAPEGEGDSAGKHPLKLGEARIAWNRARTEANMALPILSLPDTDSAVRLRLTGYPFREPGKGRLFADREPEGRVAVPAGDNLVRVESVELATVTTDQLRKEYRLSVTANVLLPPETLLKHLKVVQLPLKRNPEALEPFNWAEAPAITEADLALAGPVGLELETPSDVPAASVVFRLSDLDRSKGTYLYASVAKGLEAPSGVRLGNEASRVLDVPVLDRELCFMQAGSVLALNSNGKLGLQSTGLDGIRWEVAQVLPEYVGMLASYGSFATPSAPFDQYATRSQGVIPLQQGTAGSPQFSTLDLRPFLKEGKGIFQVSASGFVRNAKGKEESVAGMNRFVLATDLGLMLKKASDGSRSVFVCSLADSNPVSRVRIEVLGANGLPVYETRTDVEGRAEIPSLDGLSREKFPVAVVASRGDDLAFLPLQGSSLTVNTSRYALPGRGNAFAAQAHVFSQRDLYRPGETLHFGALVRNADFTPFDPEVPMEGLLRTPGGQTVRLPLSLDPSGMTTVSWQSPDNARTGRYTLNVRVADTDQSSRGALTLGSASVQIEEFQPDVLSISAMLRDAGDKALPEPGRGWTRADSLKGLVRLRNLFGLAAQDRRVTWQIVMQPVRFSTREYYDYTFPTPEASQQEPVTLADSRTDARGEAAAAIDLESIGSGSWGNGMYRIALLARGFEPGQGRQAAAVAQTLYSRLESVLGYRPSANLRHIPQDRATTIDFVALDPALARTDPGPLTFIVSSERQVPALVSDSRGYRYDFTPLSTELGKESVRFAQTQDGPSLIWPLPTGTPGDHVLTVLDATGRQILRIPYSVAGLASAAGENPAPGMLRARTDKDDYAPGDTMRVALTLPFDGLGLLTLERDKVESHAWFRAKAGESVQTLPIPKDFEGRGYLNVSFIRSLHSRDIAIQPHVYTAEALTVNIARRDMRLALSAPETARPGETLTVRVSSKDKGRAVVFAVDEGVLQVTGFATPSPLDRLLKQRMLEVETMQAFDLLMPDQRHFQSLISAFGGGGMSPDAAYLNPFKRKGEPPLATWSDMVEVGPDGTDVTVSVPDYYNGAVRIMAVGSTAESVGSAATRTTVRGNLVLTPQFPLMAAPGDEFEAGFGIAREPQADNAPIALSLSLEGGVELIGGMQDGMDLAPGAEGMVRLRLRALDAPGEARVTLRAEAGGQLFSRSASLSVRPASPRMSRLATGFVSTSASLETGRTLYPYNATVEAAVSGLPLPAVRGLVRYLDAYPYGCTEQLLSGAFPYALLLKNPSLLARAGEDTATLAKRTNTLLRSTVAMLRSRYSSGSGMGSWSAHSPGNVLLTAYAADFLCTLRESGLNLDADLERNMVEDLRSMLGRQIGSHAEARANAYGIWVLSRYGDVTTRQINQLIDYIRSDMPDWNKDVTATLLAASFTLLRLDKHAAEALDLYAPDWDAVSEASNGYFDQMAASALHLTLLARHFPDRLAAVGAEERQALLDGILEDVRENRYTTFSAAQGIRALLAMAEAEPVSAIRLACAEDGGEAAEGAEADALDLGPSLTALNAPFCKAFSVDVPDGRPGVYWQIFSDGFDTSVPQEAVSEGMEIAMQVLDGEDQPVTSVKLGEEVIVLLTAKGYGKAIDDVAVVSLLPGGFELVRDSLRFPSGETYSPFNPDSTDVREDRVLVFGTLPTHETGIRYRIRAVNKGRFALPPVYAEAMYSQSLRAASAGGTIEVK